MSVWVESEGGPLVVVPESQLAHWGGLTDGDGPLETWGDYGRACSVQGDIGLIAVGGQQALVFGDEPASTTYLADERLFLRWIAADSEAELIAAAKRALQRHVKWNEDEDLTWDIGGPVVLFDSYCPGTEIEADNHLVIDIEPGCYRVRASYLDDHRIGGILVQLQPIPDAGEVGTTSQPHQSATPSRTASARY